MRTCTTCIFVGPMKAGTTWIDNYLRARGDVRLPTQVKETFFFDRNFHRGIGWYEKHFPKCTGEDAPLVEVAPSYFANSDVPHRIASVLNSPEIIVTLRHPVKRAWSHYLHLRRYGYTDKPLRQAANDFPQLLASSRYNEVIMRWIACFGEDKVHVLWLEDMLLSQDSYALDICNLLDINFVSVSGSLREKSNEAAVAPSYTIAAAGRRVSYALKGLGLYSVVNLAKKLGLQKLFFGVPGAAQLPKMTASDAKWLAEQLVGDYRELPEKHKHPSVLL